MDDHPHCQELLESLSEYIDEDLKQEVCAEIERHMAGCSNCKVVVDTLRKTVYLYQVTQEPPGLPDETRQRLYRRLRFEDILPDE